MNVTSDASGVFTFATSIARDAKLDANGQVRVSLTVIGAKGAATAGLTTFSTLGTALANGNNVNLVPFTSGDTLTWPVASNGTNKIPGQAGLEATPGPTSNSASPTGSATSPRSATAPSRSL